MTIHKKETETKTEVKSEPEQTQALARRESAGQVEYVPFGTKDKIKLNINIVRNLLAIRTKKGELPSDSDCLKFIGMCQAKRINPLEGDCYLIGFDTPDGPVFNLITAHQVYLKRAELHPEFNGMESGIIVQEGGEIKEIQGDFFLPGQKVLGGWAKVFFKTRAHPMYKRVRLERFAKPFGVWRDDPAGMICKVAESDALRSSFPTMLGGLYLREEIEPGNPVKELAKPLFETKTAKVQVAPAQAKASEPDPAIVDLRSRLAQAQLSERGLMCFLEDTGVVESAPENLEELAKTAPEAIERLRADWPQILKQMEDQIGEEPPGP